MSDVAIRRVPRPLPAPPRGGLPRLGGVDVVLAGAVIAFTVLGTVHDVGASRLDPVGIALLSCGGLGLVVQRRWPLVALAIALAAQVTYLALGHPESLDWVPTTVALGSVTHARGWRWGVPLALGLLVLSTSGGAAAAQAPAIESLLVVVGLGCAVAVGEWLRTRRAYLQAVEARAAALAGRRQEEARRLVDAERLRIAREVHDVVAHAMASISVQAGVGEHLATRDPPRAGEALGAIRRTSGTALDDLRGIVGALRLDDGPVPTPGLDDLGTVVSTARDAGVAVEVVTTGTPRPLAAAVDAAAFRIVQEAVTNALRHGKAAEVEVRLGHGPAGLDVHVRDPGPPRAAARPADADGHGIRGMRERAALLGGRLTAGPCPDGGFAVDAHLPWRAGRP